MLHHFPKQRPPLDQNIAEIYKQQYQSNRQGDTPAASLAQKVESWLHKQVAADVMLEHKSPTTLELGAGTLNQLQYETAGKNYDIVEPFPELFETSKSLSEISSIYSDISEVSNDNRYQRITSIAVLEHICNLPEVVARSSLLLAATGRFRASIPSEGSPIWALGWKLTTGLEFKLKYGLDYGQLMKHEHVNSAEEIEYVLRYFFKNVEMKIFGLSRYLSLYQFFNCYNPDLKKCRDYLDDLSKPSIRASRILK
ncbi:class I SAM-dependent methyltransferase [Pelagibaculum spongiae]|uniref:class I SAM-dependent methyltransferase n=1 Tax=Pelagibaculum spongiae TaxID=2080658 RepID=UPI0015A8394F|nr:class I SAM-dependent methyltransferase [Pelagibaculum spongiae]